MQCPFGPEAAGGWPDGELAELEGLGIREGKVPGPGRGWPAQAVAEPGQAGAAAGEGEGEYESGGLLIREHPDREHPGAGRRDLRPG